MSGFSTKANTEAANGTESVNGGSGSGSSDVTQEQWKAWEEYYSNLLTSPEKPATNKAGEVVAGKFFKKTTAVGVLKVIIDAGTQPQQDSVYDSKCALPKDGEKFSEEEKAHMDKFPDNMFIWEDGKRKQTKPERNTQEYVFMYDFPKVVVDWTKHPLANLQRLGVKPLRVSYNGSFSKNGAVHLGKQLRFTPHWKTKKLSPNNPIMKIAGSSRVGSEFEEGGYDLGVLVDSCCKWELFMERRVKDGKTYFQSAIKNHSELTEVEAGDVTITVEQQIPECPTEFMGVLMNGGDYTEEALETISHRRELMAVLPRSAKFQPSPVKYPDFYLGVDWEESDLCKALTTYLAKNVGSEGGETKSENSVQTKAPEEKKVVAKSKAVESEVGEDFDDLDTIPF